VFGVPSFCTTALGAIQTLAPTKPVYVIPQCFSQRPRGGAPERRSEPHLGHFIGACPIDNRGCGDEQGFRVVSTPCSMLMLRVRPKSGEAVGAYQVLSFVGFGVEGLQRSGHGCWAQCGDHEYEVRSRFR